MARKPLLLCDGLLSTSRLIITYPSKRHLDRIIDQALSSFTAAQMRMSLRLLILLNYSSLEEVATHFANGDENSQQSDEEIVLAALAGTADEKLNGLALRLVLSDHIGIPRENHPDLVTEAAEVSAPKKQKTVTGKANGLGKLKPAAVEAMAKKATTRMKAAYPFCTGP